jgi:hypothetical protein
MYALRLSRRTASLVLAWFVVFIAVAGFAPWVQAHPMQDLCTSSGIQKAPQDADADLPSAHQLECALCTGVSAPPAALPALPPSQQALGHALRPLVSAAIAALTGAPLPARGPPSLS